MSNFEIKIEGNNVLNLSLQQNNISIIKRIIIKNTSQTVFNALRLVIVSNPDFSEALSLNIDLIKNNQEFILEDLKINFSPSYLFDLTEKIHGYLKICLYKDENELCSYIHNLAILPLNFWTGTTIVPELLVSYITPNNQLVANVVQSAAKVLQKWGKNPSFGGYSDYNKNIVLEQIAAVYEALKLQKIKYSLGLPSFEEIGQNIRLIPTLFNQKLANCLDLTLLFASVFEYLGLNPLIIILSGHALVGVWLEDEMFPEIIQDDLPILKKRIQRGIDKIILLETTYITSSDNITFEKCVEKANLELDEEDDFDFIIDVKRARLLHYTPIPLQREKLYPELTNTTNFDNIGKPLTIKQIEITNEEKEISKIDLWERKLLDLSMRNTLLSFRENKSNLRLICNNLDLLENKLSTLEEFKLLPVLKEYSSNLDQEQNLVIYDEVIEKELKNKNVYTELEEEDLENKIVHLYRTAKNKMEENGANSLYLVLGFLRWFETEKSNKKRLAPLILVPIEIIRKNSRRGYVIRLRDEEPSFNITLLELLRVKFNLNILGLDPLPQDENGIDIDKVFAILRNAILSFKTWEIEEKSYLGLFSFTQFIMWNDLKNRTEELKRNKIVDSLIKGYRAFAVDNSKIDCIKYNPIDYALPISSDSSQLAAIIESTKDSSFVLHGPPGTGKSQTITNIIANALYHKKKVLFVAEKMNALIVVQKKLQKIGLDPFILELHSNKTNKKDVLSHLDQTLQLGKLKKPVEFEAMAEKLYNKRKELNDITVEIHKKTQYGFSLYSAINNYEEYKDFSKIAIDEVIFKQKFVENDYLNLLDEYINSLELIEDIRSNPLKGLNLLEYSNDIVEELKGFIFDFRELLENIVEQQNQLCMDLQINPELSFEQVNAFSKLTKILSENRKISHSIFQYNQLHENYNDIIKILELGTIRENIKQQILEIFSLDYLKVDYKNFQRDLNLLNKMNFFKKFFNKRKLLKKFKIFKLENSNFSKKDVQKYIDDLKSYQFTNKKILDNDELLKKIFKDSYNKDTPDFLNLKNQYIKASEIMECLLILKDKCDISNITKIISDNTLIVNSELIDNFSKYEEKIKNLIIKYNFDKLELIKYEDILSDIIVKLEAISDNLDELRSFVQYNKIKDKLIKLNLANVINMYENNKIELNDIKSVFLGSVYKKFIDIIIDENKVLKDFNGVIYNKKITDYKKLIEDYQDLTKLELVYRLSSRIPTLNSFAQTSEIGILNKAIRSNGRGMSIRNLMDSIPNLLTDLTPCMLMSPISVAQYINPSFPEFDLIIFDEASQIPTAEAIGAISRGKNLIVVGDPKQLPPTSFFNTNNLDVENLEKEDLESILEDCLTLNLKEYHLKWHYRSKHESLISFSNKAFYDSSLLTFPSPNDLQSNVKLKFINGIYDRSNTKENIIEANAVVDEIIRRLQDDELIKYSIGVVTFNIYQQHLIETLLNKKIAQDSSLEEKYLNLSEPIFIKNLENVQGDERDIIIFSIGFGPDKNNKITLNFGPLNQEGGYRRLNVAVSRAKHEMIVYSSLKPEDIDLNRTNADGVKYLKAFLEYANNRFSLGKTYIDNKIENHDFLKKEIQKKLSSIGMKSNLNVGTSNYKIDIGIIDSENENQYRLGILLDDYDLEDSLNIKDIFVNEQNVLQQLGWKVHRIWALDWYLNSDKEVQKIIECFNKPTEVQIETIKTIKYDKETKNNKTDIEFYYYLKIPLFSGSYIQLSDLQEPKFYNRVENQILKIIEKEQPIHKMFLYRRLQVAWKQDNLTSSLKKFFDAILKRNRINITKEDFLYNERFDIKHYDFFRVPKTLEERRDFKEIEPRELQLAIIYLIKSQYGMNIKDLIKEMSKMFGFNRVTTTISDFIIKNVDCLHKQNLIKKNNDFLSI